MTAGRPRRPGYLALLNGDHPERVNKNEPKPAEMTDAELAVPPFDLDDVALEFWDRLVPDLITQKVMTAWDRDQFAMLCQLVSAYHKAQSILVEEGLFTVGSTGQQIKHPAWGIQQDALKAITVIASRFGLTPSDRAKLDIGGQGDDSGEAEGLLTV